MNRRNFIKILAGLPLIGSLPVLAKANEINLDDYEIITKVFDSAKPATPNRTLWYFNAVHTEKERKEVVAAMQRGEPESYFKRFRGYKSNESSE